MTSRRSRRQSLAFATAAALGLTLGLGPAGAAQAEPPGVTFDEPTAVTVEYGQYWGFTARASFTDIDQGSTVTVEMLNAPAGYHPGDYMYVTSSHWNTIISIYPPEDYRALPAGSYTVKVVADSGTPPPASATAPLVVNPAPLGIDLRVVSDPSSPTAAIVSARFTGRFVDEYQSSFFGGAALSPAGEWHIVLKDEDGEIAVERNFERTAGDDVLATSFYWTGAKADTEYSATAEFVPTGASATNFVVASATTFTYTPETDPRPVPSSTATAKPAADLPEASGFGLPLWALILGILLILGLGALVTILSVRLAKRPAAPNTGAVAV